MSNTIHYKIHFHLTHGFSIHLHTRYFSYRTKYSLIKIRFTSVPV
jgi:hypothetical protein